MGRRPWGDAEFAGCTHSVGGGPAGAIHVSQEIESWTIEAGSAGPQTFFVTGEETDSFRGTTSLSVFTHMDTGISAVPGRYTTSDVLGFDCRRGARLSPGRVRAVPRPGRASGRGR